MLFQFPPWFTIRRSNKQYLLEVAKRCAPLRAVFEFRHASWFDGDNRDETLDFLRQHELPYVCVDMPQGHRSSIPPVLAATADLAVVRFHGHSDKWTSKDIHEKFGYRYSERELKPTGRRSCAQLADETGETHVLMNNCYSRLRPAQRRHADRPARRGRLRRRLTGTAGALRGLGALGGLRAWRPSSSWACAWPGCAWRPGRGGSGGAAGAVAVDQFSSISSSRSSPSTSSSNSHSTSSATVK